MLEKITDGRTDLVFDYVSDGNSAKSTDSHGVSLIRWCAYYGDVSAIKYLLLKGESTQALGENLDLNAAAYHGHWQLCQFLIELGADVNRPLADTGETPLHAALCKTNFPPYAYVIRVLLANGADPNVAAKSGVETGGFMRDTRTRGETPLHRAAAFGSEEAIDMLIAAGASVEAKDANGDSPLSWASWYLRPGNILKKLTYGSYFIHPRHAERPAGYYGTWSGMSGLLGKPHV